MSRLESSPAPASGVEGPPPPRRSIGWAGALLGTVLILALLAGFVFYRIETFPLRAFDTTTGRLEQLAAKARNAIVALTGMQPRVTLNERVVYEQSGPVLELAVLERETSVERETENTWMGSTKHLRVRGVYRVKAGFDLRKPFAVGLDGADAGTIRLRMPRARLLTVELEKLDVLSMDNGLWNRVQPDEFEQEVNALNLDARQKAWREGMATETEQTFTTQLQQKLGPSHRIEIIHDPPEPIKPK